jgi:hypothetical protein
MMGPRSTSRRLTSDLGLVVGNTLPPLAVQKRWLSEPIRCILLAKDTFSHDDRRRVFLDKRHETFLGELTRGRSCPDIILCASVLNLLGSPGSENTCSLAPNPPSWLFTGSTRPYEEYFTTLQERQQPRTVIEGYATSQATVTTRNRAKHRRWFPRGTVVAESPTQLWRVGREIPVP